MKKQPDFTLAEIDEIVDRAALTQSDFDLINQSLHQLFIVNGKVKSLLAARKISQNIAFHDWLNCTFSETTIDGFAYDRDASDVSGISWHEQMIILSKKLNEIFGFGITTVRDRGAFFYERSFELGNGYGMVCHGGQNKTILVSVNATGLSQASEGWEGRLYVFLYNASMPSITRVDLAHDYFNPEFFTVDNCLKE
jgi:phage replication initiation protein